MKLYFFKKLWLTRDYIMVKVYNPHSVHLGITPLKNTTPSFLPSPLLNLQTIQAPPFLDNPPSILVFCELSPPPPKSWIFQWMPKILKFFILNPVLFLKVTKFLVKISQFEFFYDREICHNLWLKIKSYPPLFQQPPS